MYPTYTLPDLIDKTNAYVIDMGERSGLRTLKTWSGLRTLNTSSYDSEGEVIVVYETDNVSDSYQILMCGSFHGQTMIRIQKWRHGVPVLDPVYVNATPSVFYFAIQSLL